MIPQELLDRIREATDLVDVVSRHVSLKPAGKNLKGLCPFHQEKSPSFSVNPDRQFFHCFGCGAGGNVYHFLMRIENASFMEVVRELAEKARIPLPQADEAPENEADRQRRQLYAVLTWSAERFQQALAKPGVGDKAQTYLQQRGVTPAMIERFGLGYAPPGWDSLLRAAQRDQYSEELLERAGLLVRKDQGGYDRFRDRLMFPIHDVQGRVVGFGGRVLGEGEPKYLNSPETFLFRKGELLYGLDLARETSRSTRRLVLVEGYMDVIACHQAGVTEAVASLGTALTGGQVQLARRYADDLVYFFDSDAAGVQAARKAFDVLYDEKERLNPRPETGDWEDRPRLKAIALPGAKDPDEYLKKFGPEAFRKLLDQAVRITQFLLEAMAQQLGEFKSVEQKEKLVQAIAPVIARLPRGVEWHDDVQRLADRVGVPRRLIEETVQRLAKVRAGAVSPPEPGPVLPPRAAFEEELFFATLLRFPSQLATIREPMALARFRDPWLQLLRDQLLAEQLPEPEDEADWLPDFLGRLSDPALAELAARLAAVDRQDLDPGRVLKDCLKRLELEQLKLQTAELQVLIKDAQRQGDIEGFKQLAQQKRLLDQRLHGQG